MADTFRAFPKVRFFQHVCKEQDKMHSKWAVTYGAKIKLHGTNAAVRISESGCVTAQKRRSDIDTNDDNFDFAAWVASNESTWASLNSTGEFIVFGEWAGGGIQAKAADAVEQLPERHFFVFAVLKDEVYISDPAAIARFVPDLSRLHILPWLIDPSHEKMAVNFSKGATLAKLASHVDNVVEGIETEDPYMRIKFGIVAPGEGVVVVPVTIDNEAAPWKAAGRLIFKSKVSCHTGKKKKNQKPTTPQLTIPPSVTAFVAEFVTTPRCKQGVHEVCNGRYEKKLTRVFLEWMKEDVRNESVMEVEAMGMAWSQIEKHVACAASQWYVSMVNKD